MHMTVQSCGILGAVLQLLYATLLHRVTVSAVPLRILQRSVSISYYGVSHRTVGGGPKTFQGQAGSQQFEQEITAPQQEYYLSTRETNLGQSEGTEGRRVGETFL